MKNRPRLLILPSPPYTVHYRTDFFDRLESVYDVEYLVGEDLGTLRNSGRPNEIRIPWRKWPHQHILAPLIGFRKIASKRPDAFIVYGNINEPLVHLASLWFLLRGVPVYAWTQFHRASSSYARDRLKRLWTRLFTGVLLYSDKEREEFLALGEHPERICALNNGLADPVVERSPEELRQALESGDFLFCARLEAKNRLDILVHAFILYAAAGGRRNLSIIGSGDSTRLQKIVAEAGMEDRIRFLGGKHGEELDGLLRRAFCMVHPYGIGLSINTAFSRGVPLLAVADPACHMPEFWIFKDGRNGWGAEHSEDPERVAASFADAMAAADRSTPEDYLQTTKDCLETVSKTGTRVMAERLTSFLEAHSVRNSGR